MNIFDLVKAAVTLRQAAEHYGMTVSRSGMCCCPFHPDKHPSLKLNDSYYYCFSCHAAGDVIDFVARLFDLSNYHAAHKLAADLGLDLPQAAAAAQNAKISFKRHMAECQEEERIRKMLGGYLATLTDWKERYAPHSPADSPDERFTQACHMLDYVQFLSDLFSFGLPDDRHRAAVTLRHDQALAALAALIASHQEDRTDDASA